MNVADPASLLGLADTDLGSTDWITVDSAEVRGFVDSTGDPEASLLGLSLVNRFLPELITVQQFSAGVNVGLEGATFGPPLTGGERVRGTGVVLSVAEQGGGVQIVVRVDLHVDGRDEPLVSADTVSRFFA